MLFHEGGDPWLAIDDEYGARALVFHPHVSSRCPETISILQASGVTVLETEDLGEEKDFIRLLSAYRSDRYLLGASRDADLIRFAHDDLTIAALIELATSATNLDDSAVLGGIYSLLWRRLLIPVPRSGASGTEMMVRAHEFG